MNRFITLLLAASCLTAVGQQQIATCHLPVEINLENIEGSLIFWNDYQINEQTILVEEAGTYTATAADLNRSLNGTVDGFMEVAEIPGYELNAHTLSLWIRPSSTSGVQDLISKDGECGDRQWLLTLQSGKYHAHVWLEDHDLVMIVTEEIASTGGGHTWRRCGMDRPFNFLSMVSWLINSHVKGCSQQEMSLFEFVVELRKDATSMKEIVRPTM